MLSDIWPQPHDPETLYGRALLIHGPLPPKGWSVTRDAAGRAVYIYAHNRAAHKFRDAVIDMFQAEITERFAARGWKTNYHQQLARNWTNGFMRWVWEHLDESD